MKKIIVDPAKLEVSANKIMGEIEEYQTSFTQLFEEIDLMKSSWQGKDNQAFSNQIKGYEDDFRQIAILCKQYSEFLHTSAKAYRDMQDEITSQAMKLIN